MDSVFPALQRIEAKLDRLISGPEAPTIGREEIMRLTGTRSRTAMHEALKQLGVRPFSRGKYRRIDLTNAIGKRALELAARLRADREHELKTEAQRLTTKPNRHDD